jgi:hypothetical protein
MRDRGPRSGIGRVECVLTHRLHLLVLTVVAWLGFGCVGVFVDLHGAAYPALRTTLRQGEPEPAGPKPITGESTSASVGLTLGVEFDDGRASRWAVGSSIDAIGLGEGPSARHRFNDLRVDLTVKTFDDDTRLRVGVGGGIGSGKTSLLLDDGSYLVANGGSAVLYSGPVFVRYVGDRSVVSAMLGGSFLLLGASKWVVRGWGLTTHLTYSWSFVDTHADAVLYRGLPPTLRVADFADAARRIGCGARMGENAGEGLPAAYLTCAEGAIELHTTDGMLHVHCERSTTERCRALFMRIDEAREDRGKAH